MTDPTQAGQPSEEELRAYLEQMRAADPAELLVQAYRLLGTGAEVKLGRRDARVLIDAMAGMVEAVGDNVQQELVGQMREGVRQLQLAQVQAERQAGPAEDAGEQAQEPGAAGAGGTAGAAPGAAPGQPPSGARSPGQPGAPGQEDQRLTDRLWIPGRGPSTP